MNNRTILNIFFLPIFLFLIFYFLLPSFVLAQNNNPLFQCSGANNLEVDNSGSIHNRECKFEDVVNLAQAVVSKLFVIALAVAPLIFAYVGWLFLSSGDAPGQRDKAKKIAKNVAIGLAIMMLAWVIVNLILTALINGPIIGWTK